MNGITKITFIIVCGALLCSCATTGKPSPYQLVSEARRDKDNKATFETIKSGDYTLREIEAIAQEAMDDGSGSSCSLASDLTINYQLNPDLKKRGYRTLFQCLMLNKQYDAALSLLKKGASPEFIKQEGRERNNAIEEAAANGALDIVDELLRVGVKPTSKAYYHAISGRFHNNYETALLLADKFKPFIGGIDLNYTYSDDSLVYKVATGWTYNIEQRKHLLKMLLDNGADPDKGTIESESGPRGYIDYVKTAYVATKDRNPEIAMLLLAYGANPENANLQEQARFLANLKPGDKTKQGLVVEIRNNLVLVQQERGQRWISLIDIRS